jgi:hypothetical protein
VWGSTVATSEATGTKSVASGSVSSALTSTQSGLTVISEELSESAVTTVSDVSSSSQFQDLIDDQIEVDYPALASALITPPSEQSVSLSPSTVSVESASQSVTSSAPITSSTTTVEGNFGQMLEDEIAKDYPSLMSEVELTTMIEIETEMSELSE